jgi:NAD(P)H-flavin reductase
MMAAVQRLCAKAGVPCWASLEQFMGCGIGACLGCVVPTRLPEKYQRVCKDGPIFRAEDIAWEELDA